MYTPLCMRRWWSGLTHQTVNLTALAFVGSNPTRRTRKKTASAVFLHRSKQKLFAYVLDSKTLSISHGTK